MVLPSCEKLPVRSRPVRKEVAVVVEGCHSAILIVGKEEQLVPDDSSAGRSAELIPTQQSPLGALPVGRPIVGIQFVVPDEFEGIAMILIRA